MRKAGERQEDPEHKRRGDGEAARPSERYSFGKTHAGEKGRVQAAEQGQNSSHLALGPSEVHGAQQEQITQRPALLTAQTIERGSGDEGH